MTPALEWLKKPVSLSGDDWSVALLTLLSVGVVSTGFYALQFKQLEFLAGALLLGGASIVIGILLGFLFGIPRALQDDGKTAGADGGARASDLRLQQNTNLEQISDWLTKILVGVGLTQLTSLPETLAKWGDYFAHSIAPAKTASAPVVADAILIFYATCGFLLGYIWTRLFFGRQLEESVRSKMDEQTQADAKAISTVSDYLNMVRGITPDQVKAAIKSASPTVAANIFSQVVEIRRRGSNDETQGRRDQARLVRTIPIFEGLIAAADTPTDSHQYHAQLAYALKDKSPPDYKRAIEELTTAIKERGDESGFEKYELNRAICRIQFDDDFRQGRTTSDAATKAAIEKDIAVAAKEFEIDSKDTIAQWQARNPKPSV